MYKYIYKSSRHDGTVFYMKIMCKICPCSVLFHLVIVIYSPDAGCLSHTHTYTHAQNFKCAIFHFLICYSSEYIHFLPSRFALFVNFPAYIGLLFLFLFYSLRLGPRRILIIIMHINTCRSIYILYVYII